jgi:EmrB/QacA subfamily drug resistance transporter
MTEINNKRWLALGILCLGYLMIVLDTTIVNVALPSIRVDLGFSETSLVWVVNAYMLTFSGFLLLGGRLGDLFGRRRMFMLGIVLFTLASLGCGIAHTQLFLIIARAVQGLGGAIVAAVALSLIINLFTEPSARAKAMGYFGFIAAGGGAIGVFLGGLLTGTLNWHSIFLVNLPIGIAAFLLSLFLLPPDTKETSVPKLDIGGALTITISLMLAIYAIVGGNTVGWMSAQTMGLFAGALVVFLAFLFIESRISNPLVPLTIFRKRNVSVSSVIGVLWSAGMFAWFFLSALYLQLILGYTPLHIGLSFLPANLIMACFSLGLSAKIVMRFGTKKPVIIGMFLVSLGLISFAFSPLVGSFVLHVLPGMVLLGIGAGLAFNPILLSGMSEVTSEESGLASGVLNTSFMMGGALGLAILASIAGSKTAHLVATGTSEKVALLSGYHSAFIVGCIFALGASLLGFYLNNSADTQNADTTHI